MAAPETALRKRQQIARANRLMFIWIAVASVIAGASLVVSIMLVQRLTYNEKILGEKNNTASILRKNNEVVPALEANIRKLLVNEDLGRVKAKPEDSALQVVLDALPADANSLAFGASLQSRLLGNIDGLTVESTTVDPVVGVESTNEQLENTQDASSGSSDVDMHNQITFRFTVSGSADALKTVLQRLESSIRAVHVRQITTESSGGNLQMKVEGATFYEPGRTVELKDKTVRP